MRVLRPLIVIIAGAAVFLTGVLASPVINTSVLGQHLMGAALIPVRLKQSEFPLINPLLLCDVGNAAQSTQNQDLRKVIQSFVNNEVEQGDVSQMSIYLQRYGGGGWVGINEDALYAPASLLKVPLMIAYYKIAEDTPGFLNQKIFFNGADRNTIEYFTSPNHITASTTYTIDDLIQHMIEASDNSATALLESAMSSTTRQETYSDLGLPTPPTDPSAEYISVKNYAYFFRILYNATYLDRTYSQRALNNLSAIDFSKGIRAGVPQGITVAQKFGERTVLNADGSVNRRELHDCGIIYKKGSNYLLCVMTKGNDFDRMAKSIAGLSSLVYKNVLPPPSPTPN